MLIEPQYARMLMPPSGEEWLREIKHDGFRVIARKDGRRAKLYSLGDLTDRFPQSCRRHCGQSG